MKHDEMKTFRDVSMGPEVFHVISCTAQKTVVMPQTCVKVYNTIQTVMIVSPESDSHDSVAYSKQTGSVLMDS